MYQIESKRLVIAWNDDVFDAYSRVDDSCRLTHTHSGKALTCGNVLVFRPKGDCSAIGPDTSTKQQCKTSLQEFMWPMTFTDITTMATAGTNDSRFLGQVVLKSKVDNSKLDAPRTIKAAVTLSDTYTLPENSPPTFVSTNNFHAILPSYDVQTPIAELFGVTDVDAKAAYSQYKANKNAVSRSVAETTFQLLHP